ncbi:hypothetical protein [Pseudoduganella violacea]|uniref:Uncharacterized protein n=1 Tax=Pseudoduganella violacea TaxID=1715466 RepID=A0A7W5BEI8_9BURK|nr:hypothetical protein [Pseudoduganella violacea]MBB3121722.1 hypothetical protein [Pseudoduganella violacea]
MKRNLMDVAGAVAAGGAHECGADPQVVRLEAMRPGQCLRARDGTPFIRTDRTCICFCNLVTGRMCSAKDICYRYGGVDETGPGPTALAHLRCVVDEVIGRA